MNDQNHSISAETEYFWDVLKTIFDPEIGVNIVDLGLVYEVNIDRQEDGKFYVNINLKCNPITINKLNYNIFSFIFKINI